MDDNEEIPQAPMRFNSISQLDVPKGRDGKHKKIITLLLDLKPSRSILRHFLSDLLCLSRLHKLRLIYY